MGHAHARPQEYPVGRLTAIATYALLAAGEKPQANPRLAATIEWLKKAEVTGTYSASIPAGPGSLGGTMALFGTDTGSTLRTSSEAKVFIPFVGGKLEQLMLVNLVDLFRTEAQVTADWLAEQ